MGYNTLQKPQDMYTRRLLYTVRGKTCKRAKTSLPGLIHPYAKTTPLTPHCDASPTLCPPPPPLAFGDTSLSRDRKKTPSDSPGDIVGEQNPLGKKKMLPVKESLLPAREEDWDFSSSSSCRVSAAKKSSGGTVSPAKDPPLPRLPPTIVKHQRISRQRGSGFFSR